VPIRETYPADSAAPAAARVLCARALNGAGSDSAIAADAALVVTELVTNAVNAGTSQVTVEFAVRPGNLRITVTDDAPGQPVMIGYVPDESSRGRGLQIVSMIALRWGTVQIAEGKQVWAELST
jgi:anti-sigma regulatory factor (Ser/Thr protein kinase)